MSDYYKELLTDYSFEEEDPNEYCACVLDIGSGMAKLGFSGDDAPRAVFPTIVGRPKFPGIMVGMDAKDCFVGDEAQAKRGILILRHPVPFNVNETVDWKDMEKIMHHSFYNELCITPEEHPLFFTDLPKMEDSDYERFSRTLFETFCSPAMYICNQSVCALYASGKTSGVVLTIGHGMSEVVPIFEGLPLLHGVVRHEHVLPLYDKRISGKLLTETFLKEINKRGLEFTTTAEREIARDMKEKLCYICSNFPKECEKFKEGKIPKVEYEMPDGQIIEMGKERFTIPEVLFHPQLVEWDLFGIQHLIKFSVNRVNTDHHKDFFENIVLSGGSTMFRGIQARLTKELESIVSKNYKISVTTPVERKYTTWIGGSIMSSLSTFKNRWCTRRDYNEYGPMVIKRKCPESIPKLSNPDIPMLRKLGDEDLKERISFVQKEVEISKKIEIKSVNGTVSSPLLLLL